MTDAGAVVLEGTEVPPGSLVDGVPGRVRRTVTEAKGHTIGENAQTDLALTLRHAQEAET